MLPSTSAGLGRMVGLILRSSTAPAVNSAQRASRTAIGSAPRASAAQCGTRPRTVTSHVGIMGKTLRIWSQECQRRGVDRVSSNELRGAGGLLSIRLHGAAEPRLALPVARLVEKKMKPPETFFPRYHRSLPVARLRYS